MKIYTTYFARTKDIPNDSLIISIALYPPHGASFLTYHNLTPTRDILRRYKENGDISEYTRNYKKQVLGKLTQEGVYDSLEQFGNGKNVYLVCYEGKNKFCHRHLVANWLNEANIQCEEME